ncbi:MAG: DNA-3-methyladenine glycosylase I [Crenarchaeota archaeon]|nr:MAG: DNA-3-methyladenine glycosylase I [Thermoproteota archaeon]RDJ33592.1 MAG: DNA-3-methyladenine glycosylase I [Thermoproteota archaeon]RDJ38085.1 MAG: DNA-3-methyladenine glycosylase I [Thermoproteota archaeon]RDJ39145.1 MAG: DNA-3-methyladenine glycosylase I [Thermoproteota archaeon]
MKRCKWAESEPNVTYHDTEWGVPVHDDRKLFEILILEGAQAGLSWVTILKRRETYRAAFCNFDISKISKFTQRDVNRLLKDKGIIRNKLKINSAINNAKRFLEVQSEFGSFDRYIWEFVDFTPIKNKFQNASEIPASTTLSDKISKDLKKRGFNFVGSTICYAFMQAVGIVNDHTTDCFRH